MQRAAVRQLRLMQCRGPGATPAHHCRLRLDWGWLGRDGAAVPGDRELGEAGLLSPREAALLGEAVVYFVPEVTLAGFASALGSCRRVAQRVPPGLRKARESPALCGRHVFSSACFILPSPRLPGELRAGNEEPLAAGAGGWGRRARRAPFARHGDPGLAASLGPGRHSPRMLRCP